MSELKEMPLVPFLELYRTTHCHECRYRTEVCSAIATGDPPCALEKELERRIPFLRINLETATPLPEMDVQVLKRKPAGTIPPRGWIVMDAGDGGTVEGLGFLSWRGDDLYAMIDNARYTPLKPEEQGVTWQVYTF